MNELALAPGAPDRLFAGADAALYSSDEGGAPGSWDCVPETRGAVIDLAELDGMLYAATVFVERISDPDDGVRELTDLGLFRTSDGGETWDPLPVPEGAEGVTEAAADLERGRLLIGTRAGLWALTP